MSTHIPQSMGLVSSSTCLFHCCFSTVWPPCEETRVHPFWTAVLVPPASKHKQHYMVESINTTSFLPAVSPDKWTKQTVLDLVSRTLVSTFQSCINSTAGTIHHWRDVCLHHWWHSADKRTRHTHNTLQCSQSNESEHESRAHVAVLDRNQISHSYEHNLDLIYKPW